METLKKKIWWTRKEMGGKIKNNVCFYNNGIYEVFTFLKRILCSSHRHDIA